MPTFAAFLLYTIGLGLPLILALALILSAASQTPWGAPIPLRRRWRYLDIDQVLTTAALLLIVMGAIALFLANGYWMLVNGR